MTITSLPETEARRDALVERLFSAALGAFDLYAVYVGDRLGLYRALLSHGPLTSAELAAVAGVDERYGREWLEQQAVTGLLEVDEERRCRLPAGHDEALCDEGSLAYVAPFARFIAAVGRPLPALVEAFRTGAGIPYADYGHDLCGAQASFTRPLFEQLLGSEWLPAVADVHARLLADPPARVADLGCGAGDSTIAIARAYAAARVDGIDLDPASIELARGNLPADLAGRVTFTLSDAADPGLRGGYDLVTIFEALRDMSRPVEVLRAARGLLEDHGSVIVADERVADSFSAPGDDIERLYYGFSLTHCLPVGLTDPPAAGTGAVMRAETVARYAAEAGFADVETLPIDNEFWRFYRLRP